MVADSPKDYEEEIEVLKEFKNSHDYASHNTEAKWPAHSTLVDITLMFSLILLPAACCAIIGSTITLAFVFSIFSLSTYRCACRQSVFMSSTTA
jgi:hypothetical protein